MSRYNKLLFLTFGLVCLGLVGGVWMQKSVEMKREPELITGTLLPTPKSLPHFRLTDDKHNFFSDRAFENQWSLVFFGYTQCPELCPKTLKIMSEVKQIVGFHSPIEMYLVTINPDGDTPEQLSAYFAQSVFQNGIIHGLTGKREMIGALAKEIGLHVAEQIPEVGHIEHSGSILVINPKGQIQAIITHPEDPFLIAQDLRGMLRYYDSQVKQVA